ncbi:MAG: tetratricopeptide repeat protein [Bacteroidetes bacterium]|nr:tetratricopeptide repeat protein [Bacteroidota bacterium]
MSRLDQLEAFLKEDPTDSFLQFALGSEFAKLGNLEKAIEVFEGLRQSDPAYVGLYLHLGNYLAASGRTDKAISVYRDGVAMATLLSDLHARSELQSALLEAETSGDL